MNKNDDKIKNLLGEIDNKKKAMGPKPKAYLKTNGLIDGVNINTINSVDKCVDLAAKFLLEKHFHNEACILLGLIAVSKTSELNDALDDIKLRAQMITWEIKKRELDLMEKKLKDLRSEDAKTDDALADIEKNLNA